MLYSALDPVRIEKVIDYQQDVLLACLFCSALQKKENKKRKHQAKEQEEEANHRHWQVCEEHFHLPHNGRGRGAS